MSVPVLIAALIAGFLVLIFAGDALVRGAAALARRGGVPPLVVGLTIVAFGTSAPELFVSIQAVLSGAPRLAMGNVVGSNIANILLVLSIPALFAPIPTRADGVRHNTVIMVIASIIFVALSLGGAIGLWQGGVLVAGIVAYLILQSLRARASRDAADIRELVEIDDMEGMPDTWRKIWTFIAVGVVGLPLGGWLIVTGGVGIADAMAIPREFVGLTAVAFGTSLPELATSVIAAVRKHADVAIGNVVGSNVFNIFAVGGAIGLAGGAPVPDTFFSLDFPVMMGAALVLLVIVLLGRRIGWATGAIFGVAYLTYLFVLARVEGLL